MPKEGRQNSYSRPDGRSPEGRSEEKIAGQYRGRSQKSRCPWVKTNEGGLKRIRHVRSEVQALKLRVMMNSWKIEE